MSGTIVDPPTTSAANQMERMLARPIATRQSRSARFLAVSPRPPARTATS